MVNGYLKITIDYNIVGIALRHDYLMTSPEIVEISTSVFISTYLCGLVYNNGIDIDGL